MAAVTSIADVISFASAIFPEEVIEIMKRSKFTMEDVHHLTRDDIDQEFKTCRFGIRKSLWLFFASFNIDNHGDNESVASSVGLSSNRLLTLEGATASESPFTKERPQLDQSPTKRRGTQNETCAPSKKDDADALLDGVAEIVLAVIDRDSQQEKKSDNEENEFLLDVVGDLSDSNDVDVSAMTSSVLIASSSSSEDSYPGGIPTPFPLSPCAKTCLTQGAGRFKSGKSQLTLVVGEVLDTVRDALKRRPTIHELRTVARKLYEEYPALEAETTRCSEALFYQLLRKKSNYRMSLERRISHSLPDNGKPGVGDEGHTLGPDNSMEMSTCTAEVSATSEAGDELEGAIPSSSQNASGRRGKYLQRYLQPPMRYLSNADKEPYPGTVQAPFPLSDSCKKYLSVSSRDALVKNRFAYHVTVREACGITYRNLGRAPTLEELRIVAKNLSIEYPVLQCEGKTNFENLYFAFRKNVNNSVRRRLKRSAGATAGAGHTGVDADEVKPVKKEIQAATETKSRSQRYKAARPSRRGKSKKTKGR